MATIAVAGWGLTEYLGRIYERKVEAESRSDVDLLASRLAGETVSVDSMVIALAGSPSIQSLLSGESDDNGKRMLQLAVAASGAELGYILDRQGKIVATSARGESAPEEATADGTSSYLEKSNTGEEGYHFAFDAAKRRPDYFATRPIEVGAGGFAGIAVLKKSLDVFEADLRQYHRSFFLVDPHGVVLLTNRPEMLLRSMWPLPAEMRARLTRQFGQLNYRPMMEREVADGTWTVVDGVRDYVRRRYANHSRWSLVILKPTEEIFASRVLGIAVTFLTTIIALVYFLARERGIHDAVQMDKRLQLQELASDLRFRATTDPLTGLNNRRRFNEAMALEIFRSHRYETPLSLVLYDVDHFKKINDTHGHLVGDNVLIELSRLVASHIRKTDVLARWGGEEFAILLPDTNAAAARQFADKLRESISEVAFDAAGAMTCSIGVAQYENGMSPEAFIAGADEALYNAKINGRNRVELAPQRVAPDVGWVA
jgi:diguanylate cyclase (GGDEF)-like protein